MKNSTKFWIANIVLMVICLITPHQYVQIWAPVLTMQVLCLILQLYFHVRESKQMIAEQEQELRDMLAAFKNKL